MIDKDWRPLCPNCKKNLNRNGHTNPPLLVFDLCDNYWLNSPNKYVCQNCEDFTNSCDNEEDKRKFNFTSTSSEILQQIGASYPELMDIFPCETSHRNTIDKRLMNLIIHSAVKGVGPSAFRDNIISFHQLEWQKRENQWAQYVLKYLNQPFVFGAVHRNDIVKCPEYFSLQLGGCVPSAKWLLQMFCLSVTKKRQYYDSECLKRARNSKILAVDASYKVPEWMMKWGGQRIYETLHSGTNEYNEIVLQRFSTSDNHDELGSNLESLGKIGLNPYLCFSDDPGRDESLLKRTFSNLKTKGDDDEDVQIESDLENIDNRIS